VTIAPDIVFQHCANTAAAVIAKAPPFVSYRVSTHVSAPSIGKQRDVIRSVMVRTSDDVAILQDLPQGQNQIAHGFPVTPAFDALSNFTLSWKVGMHTEVSSYVHDVQPLTYTTSPSSADVVVVRLRQYRVEYAPDSSDDQAGKTHLTLEPYDFVKREVVRPDSTFFLRDVYIDNASGLPTEIKYAGGDDISFVVDYATIEGHWLVDHAHYEETLRGPLRIGSLHVIADAVYDQFSFPDQAPDPRLKPA
jgi:hypothetical protein